MNELQYYVIDKHTRRIKSIVCNLIEMITVYDEIFALCYTEVDKEVIECFMLYVKSGLKLKMKVRSTDVPKSKMFLRRKIKEYIDGVGGIDIFRIAVKNKIKELKIRKFWTETEKWEI